MLGAAWSLASALGLDPDVVLGWRGSQVAMWTEVADRQQRRELLREMVLLTHAVWDPSELPKLLRDPEPMTRASAEDALARAERVLGTRMREVSLEELKERRARMKNKGTKE